MYVCVCVCVCVRERERERERERDSTQWGVFYFFQFCLRLFSVLLSVRIGCLSAYFSSWRHKGCLNCKQYCIVCTVICV